MTIQQSEHLLTEIRQDQLQKLVLAVSRKLASEGRSDEAASLLRDYLTEQEIKPLFSLVAMQCRNYVKELGNG